MVIGEVLVGHLTAKARIWAGVAVGGAAAGWARLDDAAAAVRWCTDTLTRHAALARVIEVADDLVRVVARPRSRPAWDSPAGTDDPVVVEVGRGGEARRRCRQW